MVGHVAPVDLGYRVVDRGLHVAHIDQALHVVWGREGDRLDSDRVPAPYGVRHDRNVGDHGGRTRGRRLRRGCGRRRRKRGRGDGKRERDAGFDWEVVAVHKLPFGYVECVPVRCGERGARPVRSPGRQLRRSPRRQSNPAPSAITPGRLICSRPGDSGSTSARSRLVLRCPSCASSWCVSGRFSRVAYRFDE